MALERLEGRPTSRGPLRLAAVRAGRFPEETDAVLTVGEGERPVARVKHFAGRAAAHVRPWVEALVERDDEGFLSELVRALAELLPPGSHVMVGYGDDETERGLKRGFPPAATPVGKALLDAGCAWFKDWYYPEGWLEGGFKLQGNKPLDGEVRRGRLAELRAELDTWLAEVEGRDDELTVRARERAHDALEAIRADR